MATHVPGDGRVLVRVKAAGINPSEAVIRTLPQIDQIWVR